MIWIELKFARQPFNVDINTIFHRNRLSNFGDETYCLGVRHDLPTMRPFYVFCAKNTWANEAHRVGERWVKQGRGEDSCLLGCSAV
jgi:hypothetical protein